MPARPLRAAWRLTDHPATELWTGAVDVVWGPNFVVPPARRAAEVVTVHDLTPLHFPELCHRDTLAYPALVRRAVARGALVQTDSEAVAAEVRDWLGLPPERVVAVPLGVDPPADGRPGGRSAPGRRGRATCWRWARWSPARTSPRWWPPSTGPPPSSTTWRWSWPAPTAGGSRRSTRPWPPPATAARIRRLGWVDDAARADLLAGACCLAFPSIYEGFGLPPLEAMAAGVPVVCSDLPVLAEVTGNAARRVPARDTAAWADALVALAAASGSDDAGDGARQRPARAELARRGRQQAARFSWDACAARLGELLRAAAAGAGERGGRACHAGAAGPMTGAATHKLSGMVPGGPA